MINNKRNKFIVTGAIGHIGSYLIRDLATFFPGSEIVLIDNLSTQRFASLFDLPKVVKYQFIEADVISLDLLPLFKDAYVVIHLAAITDAAGSFDKPELIEANNYQATLKVAEACVQTGTRLLALSSTSVYGTQNEIVTEDCALNELRPQSPYAATKLKEEELVKKLYKEKGLKVVCCRFGTIFGVSPGMRFHTAVNKFCWQAVMKQPITVWTTAYDQKRPYLDLYDASRAISFIINNDLFNGKIYNILTENTTVKEIINKIKEVIPNIRVNFNDNKIMNQLSYEVSCDKFISEGFAFNGNLRRGIFDTINILNNANSK